MNAVPELFAVELLDYRLWPFTISKGSLNRPASKYQAVFSTFSKSLISLFFMTSCCARTVFSAFGGNVMFS